MDYQTIESMQRRICENKLNPDGSVQKSEAGIAYATADDNFFQKNLDCSYREFANLLSAHNKFKTTKSSYGGLLGELRDIHKTNTKVASRRRLNNHIVVKPNYDKELLFHYDRILLSFNDIRPPCTKQHIRCCSCYNIETALMFKMHDLIVFPAHVLYDKDFRLNQLIELIGDRIHSY